MLKQTTLMIGVIVVLLALVAAVPALAQDAPPVPEPVAVTEDDVNTVAKKLYCPVCENIPLDACGTAACDDWRYEIQLQLESGFTEQQIIDDFVTRFGDRVVGTPQDPILRALSLYTPWLTIVASMLVAGWWLLRRSRRPGSDEQNDAAPDNITARNGRKPNDSLRQLLEQDIAG